MTLLTIALLASTAQAAVDAPITAVTVYSDRARVVRTATLSLSGREKVELPLLPDTVDPASIRMEASQAEVERVEIARVSQEDYPTGEAQKLLAAIEAIDDKIASAGGERAAHAAALDVLQKIQPQPPAAEPLRPPPRLNPAGWGGALAFARTYEARTQAKIREADRRLVELTKERATLVEKARLLGGAQRRSGHKVTATISGKGAAKVRLVYMVRGARWYPGYDLQLAPATGQVAVQFGGQVSQETGEDWVDAQLTLSTAIPATATQFPRITTWKIGERDRFVPTPMARLPQPPQPPPASPASREERVAKGELLRLQLRALSGDGMDRDADGIPDTKDAQESTIAQAAEKKPMPKAADAPLGRNYGSVAEAPSPAPPQRAPVMTVSDKMEREVVTLSATRPSRRSQGYTRAPEQTESVGLLPPPGYTRPAYSPDLPVALAGGWDLTFPSVSKETVRSGKGARKVALFAKTWPVSVERKVYPALAPDAYLVAELKNPSTQALPGGKAHLFVGADPAGEATLKMVAPGESFTLPLGLDRAIRPIRNVKLVTTEKGVISKDEVNRYEVTIELSNPYRTPLPVRVINQIPVTDEKEVDVQLITASPGASDWDKVKGSLGWRITVPASGKSQVSFVYSIKRPKGWRLHQ